MLTAVRIWNNEPAEVAMVNIIHPIPKIRYNEPLSFRQ